MARIPALIRAAPLLAQLCDSKRHLTLREAALTTAFFIPLKGEALDHNFSVRVVRRASGYFAMLSLQSPVSIADTSASGHPLGIDIGLDKFLATTEL